MNSFEGCNYSCKLLASGSRYIPCLFAERTASQRHRGEKRQIMEECTMLK